MWKHHPLTTASLAHTARLQQMHNLGFALLDSKTRRRGNYLDLAQYFASI